MTRSSHLLDLLSKKFKSDVIDVSSVGGGCINETFKVTLQNGFRLFVKQNRLTLLDMFEKEAKGLQLLARASNEIHIPEIHDILEDEDADQVYLVLSFVEEGRPTGDFDRRFGRAIAKLHQNSESRFGLDHDNYIGRLPQKNEWRDNWISFFIECRLEPQIKMAKESGYFSGAVSQSFERLYKQFPDMFPDEPPCLLHGDLWGGNYLCDSRNQPVLVDPAVYYGHREAELSFTQLFGGFSRDFYNGYDEIWPLESGFGERKDIFNLYPLLVHVNLFGGSYVGRVQSIMQKF